MLQAGYQGRTILFLGSASGGLKRFEVLNWFLLARLGDAGLDGVARLALPLQLIADQQVDLGT